MVLDTRKIPEGHSESVQNADLASFQELLPALRDKVRCTAAIDRAGATIYVQLEFSGTITLECSRCLNEFQFPVGGNLRLVLKEQAGKSGPATDEEALDFYFDSQHFEVDLSPAIYEEIMIAVPLKPLCSETCKGIELKGESVDTGETDPRWEKLKNFRKNQ